jgi:hypothetical protein
MNKGRKYITSLGWTVRRPRKRYEDNIKIDLQINKL